MRNMNPDEILYRVTDTTEISMRILERLRPFQYDPVNCIKAHVMKILLLLLSKQFSKEPTRRLFSTATYIATINKRKS